jgi:hypothetical protein
MMGRKAAQPELYVSFSLDAAVPRHHILRKIAAAIDFEFVPSLADPYYSRRRGSHSALPEAQRSGPPPASTTRAGCMLPGLIDGHVHIQGQRNRMPSASPFAAVKHFLRLCMLHGVTTIRDTGNSLETVFYAREWSERYDGPRVFASGPMLDSPPLAWPDSRLVYDAPTAREQVHKLAVEGVDFIKAYRHVRPSLLTSIVEEAAAHDLPVAIDPGATSARAAAERGVLSVEHVANLVSVAREGTPDDRHNDCVRKAMIWAEVDIEDRAFQEGLEVLARRRVYVVPTLAVFRRWCLIEELLAEPDLQQLLPILPYHAELIAAREPADEAKVWAQLRIGGLSTAERAQVHEGLARMEAATLELLHAGTPVAGGTDTGNPSLVPGKALHDELTQMVAAGLSPPQALTSVTATAAALLRRPELGVVVPGAAADLIVVDGDPLTNIADIRRVRAVMKNGSWVDPAHLRSRTDAALTSAVGITVQAGEVE